MSEVCGGLGDAAEVIVGLVTSADPGLDRDQVAAVVATVAGGRAKHRKLARALSARPGVLTDGLSPAPRVVGDLLIALVNAGASAISAPRCADCAKPLRSLQRRGQEWLCSVCGPVRQPCACCGKPARVGSRDRDGQPRCARCRPETGGDPVQVVIDIVAKVDPTLSPQIVAAAVHAAVPQAGRRHQLAWALADRPELLTGAGAQAGAPSVLRLIEGLCAAGATGIVRPPCPRCGRTIALVKPRGGLRLCRNCVAKSRAEPCGSCGRISEPVSRNEQGRPVCATCFIRDPANLETCVSCGRRRIVDTRTPDGPRCPSCPPLPILNCSICSQRRACGTSRLTGLPWCVPCQNRARRCASCGQLAPIASGTALEPVCAACTTTRLPDCPICADRPRPGDCPRCQLQLRLRALLTTTDPTTQPVFASLAAALTDTDRSQAVLGWLSKPPVASLLAEFASGQRQLSHAELDTLPHRPALDHLRAVLVATGTLPARDEWLARLERFIDQVLTATTDPDDRQILHRYAVWHLLRRLRRRTAARATTREQYNVVHQHVRAASIVFDWLASEHLTLHTCGQADLDRWRSSREASHREQAGHFIRWAAGQRLTTLHVPATRWLGPAQAHNDEARWAAARRLLHDDTVSVRDRLAGLLVLLYAQPVARIARLSTAQVTTDATTVRIHLGTAPIDLPEPVAELARQLLGSKRGHATTGTGPPSIWLFAGGQPGRPISATHLSKRLKDLGIHPGQTRSTALFQLATELPAALLARMLGIHNSVAVAWQRASAGDWTNYAADLSRRSPRN